MKALRKIRKDKKLTQGDLARISGVAISTIYMFETDRIRELKQGCLKKLANAVGATVEEICEEYKEETLCTKECLNQACLLNHKKKCQSEQVCKGEYCQNQDLITEKRKRNKRKFII